MNFLFLQEPSKKRRGYLRVDCQSASKGLFLGLLCLVGGIIILIIFFVMKDSPEYKGQMFWIYSGAEIVIFTLSIFIGVELDDRSRPVEKSRAENRELAIVDKGMNS